ncbi:GntR Transcriptional regulators [Rhabdaerophilaceae bacterium]
MIASLESQTLEEPRSASQTVRAQLALRDMVLSGVFGPGERLPEVQVGERIGVSRTPVRAALVALAEEGLVEALPGGGYAAKAFTEHDIVDAVEVRGAMEGLAVRLAAERGLRPHQETGLRTLLETLDNAVARLTTSESGFGDYVRLNGEFHRVLSGLSGSRLVEREVARITTLPFASPSAFVSAQAVSPQTPQILGFAQFQHHAIVEAIRRRESTRAEALMREHARLAIRSFEIAKASQPVLAAVPGAALIRKTGD